MATSRREPRPARACGALGASSQAGFTKVSADKAFVIGFETALRRYAELRAFDDSLLADYLDEFYPTEMLVGLDAESVAADTSLRPIVMPGVTPLAIEELARALRDDGPFDTVVGSRRNRRPSSRIICHAWTGPTPDGLLAGLARDIYLCAPELVFLQMADVLPKLALLEYAYELCGSYTFVGGRSGGVLYDGVRAITTPERLVAVAALARGTRGLDNARFAAKYVHAGSRSPMETQLAIMLSLPTVHGGFECGHMRMDRRIDLPEAARLMASREYLVADIFFERAGVDVEYQGGQHGASASRARDDARSNALMMVGVLELKVWKDHLYDEAILSEVARLIRKRSGLRGRVVGKRAAVRRSELIEFLRAGTLGRDWVA